LSLASGLKTMATMALITQIKSCEQWQKASKHASSNSCSMMVSTSGWALSISSNSTMAFGQAFSCFVSWPPSSWPMYPGGEPMNLATYTLYAHS